jgi:glycosyltransferase involved in cell wall biosynthesis
MKMSKKISEDSKNRNVIGGFAVSPASKAPPLIRNILLVGFGFNFRRISGDKNFWLGLSRELSPELEKLVVVSVNSSPVKFEQEGNIYLYNVHRPLHFKKDDGKVLRFQFQKHPLPWEILERSVTMLKLIPFLKKVVKLHDIKVIHLMDNFGFLTGLVKVVFPKLRVYATAITYNTHDLPLNLYSFYQRIVLGNMDKMVASSKAYGEKLIEHGLSKEKIKVIRWGVPLANGNEGKLLEEKTSSSPKVILWTGFTQQIKIKSFYVSLSLAQNIIRKKLAVDFIFAFKPECFDKRYVSFQQEHLQVITTSPEDFPKLLESADLLLAPVESFRSIIAPPLSWLECMALGIPIITTQSPGVDEVIKHKVNGFVAESDEELEGLIEKVLEDEKLLSKVSTKAKERVKENYNLKDIAQDYLKLWREDGRTVLSRQNRLSV